MFLIDAIKEFLKRPGVILTILSICSLFLFVRYAPDPRLTYDSQDYINASKDLSTYFLGRNDDNHTYLYRQPALPLYLHFFQGKVSAAKWINAICYILSLWFCYFIARELKFNKTFLVLFLVLVAGSYPWIQNHFFVWTEPLFGTMLLLLTWMLLAKKSWVLVIVLLVTLFFIRKAGLFIAIGTLVVYLADRFYLKAIWTGVIVFTLFVFWELLTSGYFDGSPSQNIFSGMINQSRWHYLDAVSAWFLPRNVSVIARLSILVVITAGVFYFNREILVHLFSVSEIKSLSILIAVYFSFIMLVGVPEYSEADRLLSMILPLVMLVLVVVVREIYLQHDKNGTYVLLPFLFWLIYPLGRTFYQLFQ